MYKKIIAMVILIFITITATGCINVFVPKVDREVTNVNIMVVITGQGSVTGAGLVKKGDTVTLVATPSEGYEFSGYFRGEVLISQNATISFTATTSISYNAIFAAVDTRPIHAVTTTTMGSGIVTGAGEYREGETVALTATPNRLFVFRHWLVNSQIISTELQYSFTAIRDISIQAVFEKTLYEIIVTSSPNNAGIVRQPKDAYALGEDVILIAIPGSSYRVARWQINEMSYFTTEESITITITGDMTVKVYFVDKILEPLGN